MNNNKPNNELNKSEPDLSFLTDENYVEDCEDIITSQLTAEEIERNNRELEEWAKERNKFFEELGDYSIFDEDDPRNADIYGETTIDDIPEALRKYVLAELNKSEPDLSFLTDENEENKSIDDIFDKQ
ncbi:MAG: hypothetical protein IJ593_10620 [Lachnospiraceae bacterium]|nr:hypothetical protein [Lachnospiraceae bacterium]